MTTVFPQTGDPNAGELFALLLGQANTTDFVGEGLDVTVDTTADEATVSAGTCYTSRNTATVAGTEDVVENLGYVLQIEETTVSLPHTETVLAIVPDHGTTDSISIGTYQFVDDIPDSGLHIATVDRDTGDIDYYNRDPDISAADLAVAGSAVVDGPLSVSDDISLSGVLKNNGETLITQDGDFDISDVENSQLVNDSVTVSADGDLSGGGSVSLGETVSLSVDTTDRYTDSEAVSAVDGEVDTVANSVSALDSQVSTNVSDISSLESDKLDSVEYTPEEDSHDRYSDSEAVSAIDDEISESADSVSALDSVVSDKSDLPHDHTSSDESAIPDSGLVEDYVTEAESDTYTDSQAVSAVDGEITDSAESVSALDSQVSTNVSDISSLESDKLDSVEYTPEEDSHDRYTDLEAVSAVDGEVSVAAVSVSGLDATVDSNESDISSLESDKLDVVDYNPEVDTHDRYSDAEAVSAVDSNVSDAAASVSGLDSQVSTNTGGISSLESEKLDSVEYTPEQDTHDRYTDTEAISAVDGEVSSAAVSVSGLDTQVSSNTSSISTNQTDISTNADDISSLESDKLDASQYTPEEDINSVTASEELSIPVASEGDPAPSESSIAFDPEEGALLVAEEV